MYCIGLSLEQGFVMQIFSKGRVDIPQCWITLYFFNVHKFLIHDHTDLVGVLFRGQINYHESPGLYSILKILL